MVAFENELDFPSSSSNDESSPNRPIMITPQPQNISDSSDTDKDHATSPKSKDNEDRPTQSYVSLISMAILNHPEKRMVLGDIYQYIMDKYPHYKKSQDKAWRNSIRHNLSINECFIKAGRLENGKGNYWAIHPACVEDFSKGDFRRRQARRRARRSQQRVHVSSMSETYKSNLHYVPMVSAPASGASSEVRPSSQYRRDFTSDHGLRNHPYARPASHRQNYIHSQPKHNIENSHLRQTAMSFQPLNVPLNGQLPSIPANSNISPNSRCPTVSLSSSSQNQHNFYPSSLGDIPRERPPVGKMNTRSRNGISGGTVAPPQMNLDHYRIPSLSQESAGTSQLGFPHKDIFLGLEPLPELSTVPELQISNIAAPSYDVSGSMRTSPTILTSLDDMASFGYTNGTDLVAAIGGSMFVPSLASYAPGQTFTEMPALRDAINGLSCLSY